MLQIKVTMIDYLHMFLIIYFSFFVCVSKLWKRQISLNIFDFFLAFGCS